MTWTISLPDAQEGLEFLLSPLPEAGYGTDEISSKPVHNYWPGGGHYQQFFSMDQEIRQCHNPKKVSILNFPLLCIQSYPPEIMLIAN